MNVAARSRMALLRALVKCSPTAKPDRYGYVDDVRANLVAGVDLEDIRADFEAGAGDELGSKMRAVHSSSALAANTFGRWRKNPSHLRIQGVTGFNSLRFEAQCATGLGGVPPHLDVLAISHDAIVGIESKCTEYLAPKRAYFSPRYDTISDARAKSVFFSLIARLRENANEFKYLDVAQLVKHYLGLTRCWPGIRLVLLYAFWEPRNAGEFREFRDHREEVDKFSGLVRAESDLVFNAVTHREFWEQWENADAPPWLRAHVSALRERYDILI
jgi:hypothetical protein